MRLGSRNSLIDSIMSDDREISSAYFGPDQNFIVGEAGISRIEIYREDDEVPYVAIFRGDDFVWKRAPLQNAIITYRRPDGI